MLVPMLLTVGVGPNLVGDRLAALDLGKRKETLSDQSLPSLLPTTLAPAPCFLLLTAKGVTYIEHRVSTR